MSAPRVDPLTGEMVQVVASRQARPNLPTADCPFCHGGARGPRPLPGARLPEPLAGAARRRVRGGALLPRPRRQPSRTLRARPGPRRGRPLGRALAEPRAHAADVDYVLVFENRGSEVGATISHPHGQIYAFDLVPAVAAPRARAGRRRCRTRAGRSRRPPRVRAWDRGGPGCRRRRPGPTRSCSRLRRRCPTCRRSPPTARDELAALLVDVVGRLDRLFDAPMPYMLWFHQRPFDGGDWPTAWVHAHIAPLLRSPGTVRFVAAGELGGGDDVQPGRSDRRGARAARTPEPLVDTIAGSRAPRPMCGPLVASTSWATTPTTSAASPSRWPSTSAPRSWAGRRRSGAARPRRGSTAASMRAVAAAGDGPDPEMPGWGRYVTAVVAEVGPTRGFDGRISTTIPIGAGLSSSAALEVAVALRRGLAARTDRARPRVPAGRARGVRRPLRRDGSADVDLRRRGSCPPRRLPRR